MWKKEQGKEDNGERKERKKERGGAEKNILLNDSFLCKHDPV